MLTKETLLARKAEYLQAAERSKLDSIANAGAADAIDALIKELEQSEVKAQTSPMPAD